MIKPINLKEMVLRINALLRRAQLENRKHITIGCTELDYEGLTVTVNGVTHEMPPKEFYLLFKLLNNPNKVFTRSELLDEIWGMESDTDERNVDAHIKKLRKKFDIQEYMTRGVETIVAESLKATLKDPRESAFMVRFAAASKKASKRRAEAEKAGEHIPPRS